MSMQYNPDPMSFEQAVELAQQVRQTPGWHLLGVEVRSGSRLDDEQWAVQAVSEDNWRVFYYWDRADMIRQWSDFAKGLAEHHRQKREQQGEHV